MQIRVVGILCFLFLAGTSFADESVEEYVSALRDAGYTDLAIDYLNLHKKIEKLSTEELADVDFEIASLFVEIGKQAADLAERERALDAAATTFEEFQKKYPNHTRRGEAQAEVANIALQRGRLRILQAQLPTYESRSLEFAEQGRKLLRQAATTFDSAAKAIDKEYQALPLPVEDERTSRPLRKRRARLFNKLAESRFNAAYCMFLIADSFVTVPEPKDQNLKDQWAKGRTEALNTAEKSFGDIAVDYRQWLIGPIGRAWQARCMAARGEHRKARGIFEEILTNKDPRLNQVRRQAFYFQLISLVAQGDFVTVLARGEEWMRANARFRTTSEYNGILLELARANVKLAESAESDARKAERYRRANECYEIVGKTQNEFQAMARREQLRIEPLLERDTAARTFQQFMSRGTARLDSIGGAASTEERNESIAKAKEMFREAIEVAKPDDPVHEARIQLAYAAFVEGDFQEAAKVAEKEVRDAPRGPGAPQALTIALAAHGMLFEKKNAAGSATEADAAGLESLARFAIERFGSTPAGDEAKLALARLDLQLNRGSRDDIQKLLASIPESSLFHGEAQSETGRLLLLQSSNVAGKDEAAYRDLRKQALAKLMTAAESLAKSRKGKLDRLTFATESLTCELLLENGRAQDAWDRSEQLVKSLESGLLPSNIEPALRLSAALAALQAAIQLGKFDSTEKLIDLISRQRGQAESGNVTQVFVLLAQRMRDQLDKYLAEGKLEAGRAMEESYEGFLQRIAARESGQTVQSLAFVAQAMIELKRFEKAKELLDRAIELSKQSGEDAKPAMILVQVAQAQSLSGLQKHDEAVEAINKVFEAEPRSREVLFARGKILMAAGRYREAERHWAAIVQGTARQRPPQFYEALIQLSETQMMASAGKPSPSLQKTATAIRTVLARGHTTLTSEWREKLQRQLKRIENE